MGARFNFEIYRNRMHVEIKLEELKNIILKKYEC